MVSTGRNIVVGIGGGIAAYKACQIIRLFKEQGDNVIAVPTEHALAFVGKPTFEALSGNPVSSSVFDAVDEVRHVRVGKEADLIVIAPATADLIARIAMGRADDLLTATVLVATCPVVLAPAMHTEMWYNAATQANVATLRSRGITVLEPAHGRLTGSDSGPGRLLDPEQIVSYAEMIVAHGPVKPYLAGKKILITAGGTREALDPVRFIGNHSSGRQGFALAEAASQMGAQVSIVAGTTDELPTPSGAEVIRIRSAQELYAEVMRLAPDMDMVIMAAAVADFRPAQPGDAKMKKGSTSEAGLANIAMVENPDILATLVQRRRDHELPDSLQIIGFAAETGDEHHTALEYAQAKLQKKQCDYLMCNEVGESKVFGQSDNQGWLLASDGQVIQIDHGSKLEVAQQIFDTLHKDTTRVQSS